MPSLQIDERFEKQSAAWNISSSTKRSAAACKTNRYYSSKLQKFLLKDSWLFNCWSALLFHKQIPAVEMLLCFFMISWRHNWNKTKLLFCIYENGNGFNTINGCYFCSSKSSNGKLLRKELNVYPRAQMFLIFSCKRKRKFSFLICSRIWW